MLTKTSRISSRVEAVPPSGIRKFFDIAATMKDVISLGIGEPDFVTPEDISAAGIASIHAGRTGYTSNSGTLDLREAIADHLAKLYGVHYHPENEILVTVGVSEALHLAMVATLEAGDEVVFPQPSYVAYPAAILFAGGQPVAVDTQVAHEFQLTADAVAGALTHRTRALLLGYPNNPTGAVMTRERLTDLADLAERHDLLVVSDEIYDRLVYGVEHTCFAALPGMQERTLLLGGFSKAYAMTGWRIGYACGPADLIGAMRKVHQYIIMSAPTAAQYAAAYALRHGEASVQHMVGAYDQRRRLIVARLNAMGLPTFEPRGAFYCFPDIRSTGLDDETFSERLLMEERVAAVPGSAFGPSGAGYVRMAYTASYEQIETALERIERFVNKVRR
ncbi:MAG: aminotransferase class I/II-fold pyridoxal phosphate-dependent enzyme [Anaerolineae bacterium]|nr:aminotransferase class I/II-fold pyridoxal phosphate-dependent enzyme [Anaerolineae bacterium]